MNGAASLVQLKQAVQSFSQGQTSPAQLKSYLSAWLDDGAFSRLSVEQQKELLVMLVDAVPSSLSPTSPSSSHSPSSSSPSSSSPSTSPSSSSSSASFSLPPSKRAKHSHEQLNGKDNNTMADTLNGKDPLTVDVTSQSVVDSPLPSPSPPASPNCSIHDAPNVLEAKRRVTAALAELRAGRMVVVADDDDRENEGDLIMAAEKCTSETIAFMVNETSGLLCVGMTGERLDELRIEPMVKTNTCPKSTAFTVSVDYKHGTTTGISASDRALTFRKLVDATAKPEDFNRPGHCFPLRAKPGGVLERPGHTESSVDLSRLAGLQPAGVMCEITNRDGTMTRGLQLLAFAKKHKMVFLTVRDIIAYRKETGR